MPLLDFIFGAKRMQVLHLKCHPEKVTRWEKKFMHPSSPGDFTTNHIHYFVILQLYSEMAGSGNTFTPLFITFLLKMRHSIGLLYSHIAEKLELKKRGMARPEERSGAENLAAFSRQPQGTGDAQFNVQL